MGSVSLTAVGDRIDAVPEQPLSARAMQIPQVRPRDDHAVQELFHLVV
jgi:hypothetical protein